MNNRHPNKKAVVEKAIRNWWIQPWTNGDVLVTVIIWIILASIIAML